MELKCSDITVLNLKILSRVRVLAFFFFLVQKKVIVGSSFSVLHNNNVRNAACQKSAPSRRRGHVGRPAKDMRVRSSDWQSARAPVPGVRERGNNTPPRFIVLDSIFPLLSLYDSSSCLTHD